MNEELLISNFFLVLYRFNMDVYIGVDGYMIPSGFLLKELCILFSNGEYDHFLFSKPDWNLSERDIRTIRYATQHLNNLDFNDGTTPYEQIPVVLNKIKKFHVYTYSEISKKNFANTSTNNTY